MRSDDQRVTVRAVRLKEPLVVDGRLDDAVYTAVPPIADFIQQEPHEGEPATQRTEAWVLFDDRNVYVAFRCWLTEPERLVANEMRRDDINIWWNDNVGVSLDTFFDHRNGVFFQTNALGGVRDGAASDERSINYDYNTVFDVKSRRFENGWTTEFAIPFKSLRYGSGREQTWGLILQRVVRGQNELAYLTRMPASYGGQALFKYSSAAMLTGIEAPPPSVNFEVKPYVIADVTTRKRAAPLVSNAFGRNGGFDAKYGVTKSLTLDATVNTDFAQVEADDQQVNLTRFNLFFPEKREFFLEGQGIFAFSGINPAVTGGGTGPGVLPVLFFSRSIGLDAGQTVPIDAGVRLTGRAGKYTLGLIDLRTGDAAEVGALATNFVVIRAKRDILRRSAIGVLATHRSVGPGGGPANTVGGVDATLQFFQNVQINSYYARTTSASPNGDAESYLGQFRYAADRYGVDVSRLKAGPDFDPQTGFMQRRDFERTYGQLRFSPRPKALHGVRKLSYEASWDRFVGHTGRLQTRQALGTVRVQFENSDELNVNELLSEDVLERPFAIARTVTLPVGDYTFSDTRANYVFGPQRRVTGTVTLSRGSFYGGDKTEAGYGGRVEVTPRITLEPRLSLNWVQMPQGDFTARVVSNRTSLAVTPRMFVTALVQYNSSARTLGTNVRFRWEYQPGSDVFFVYSDGRDTAPAGFPTLTDRRAIIKFTRLVRF